MRPALVSNTLAALALGAPLLLAGSAQARPVEDSGRIGFFAGGRFIPHGHFIQQVNHSADGDQVTAEVPFGFAGLLSFGFRALPAIEVSLEFGLLHDHFQLQSGNLQIYTVPLNATVRWAPLDTKVYPYLGACGGYMLSFFLHNEKESEGPTSGFGGLAGVGWDFMPSWSLMLEDRYVFSFPTVPKLGELNAGGNILWLGLSYQFEPEAPIAPHGK